MKFFTDPPESWFGSFEQAEQHAKEYLQQQTRGSVRIFKLIAVVKADPVTTTTTKEED